MWSAIVRRATNRDGRWGGTTVGTRGASLPWARGRWSLKRRGSTIAGAMSTASAIALPAGSCRPTCGARPRSPSCCPSSICAGSRRAISAPRSKGCWARTRPLSPTNITRLTASWEKEYTAFRRRDLAGREYVYGGVDGVHFNIRLADDRLCTLVMIGARPNGEKELLAVEDGYRESAESWKTLLRDLKRRGMAAAALAVCDGALGFWAALREVWPETRRIRQEFRV